MLIIPAIDLKDGKCVRLKQGRMEDDTVFSDDPIGVAAQWVDLAGTLKDYLTRAAAAPAPGAPQGAHHAAPALSLRAACPVEVRIEMFRPAMALSAQPLGSDDPAQPARITEVSVTHNRLCISVPHDQPPGTYYGLLIEDGQGPAGVVTLDVLAEGSI